MDNGQVVMDNGQWIMDNEERQNDVPRAYSLSLSSINYPLSTNERGLL